MNRRDMLKVTGAAIAGTSLFGPRALAGNTPESETPSKMPKVLVIGAHPDDPETTCGGTIITLKNSYLKELAKGDYKLTIHYMDGSSATTNFYVVAASKPASNPKTGDMILISVVVMIAAAAGIGVLAYMGKKKKK